MKINIRTSLLLLSLCALRLGSASVLGSRNVATSPKVSACASNANCTVAAFDFADCVRNAPPSDPNFESDLFNCLCDIGQGTFKTWHPDWTDRLASCVLCVDDAIGADRTAYYQMGFIIGVRDVFGGFCKRGLTFNDMLERSRQLQLENNFPLRLPEATLDDQSGASTGPKTITLTKTVDACSTTAKAPGSYTYHTPTTTLQCSHDNCLRQCVRESPAAASFCATYTLSVNTCTTGFPDVVSHCNNNPTQISSACSCLATLPPQSTVSPQSQTASHHTSSVITSSPASKSSTVSASVSTKNTASSPPASNSTISSTKTIFSTITVVPLPLSSKTSTSSTSSTMKTAVSSSPTSKIPPESSKTVSSTGSAGGTSTSMSTSPSLISLSTEVTTSSAPAASSTGWVTLPPSDAIKACAVSANCIGAGSIFDACIAPSDGVEVWNCFCIENYDAWLQWVGACSECIMNALSPSVNNGLRDHLISDVASVQNGYCSLTQPDQKFKAKFSWLGQAIAEVYESPIEYFNMTLVDAPIVIQKPDPPAISLNSFATITPTIVPPSTSSSVPPSTSSLIGSSSSTSAKAVPASTSSGVAEATSSSSTTIPSWVTLPPSHDAKVCAASDCATAHDIYNLCMNTQPSYDNDTIVWNCFCGNGGTAWKSAVANCAACVAKTLPSVPSPGISNTDLVPTINYLTGAICNYTAALQQEARTKIITLGQEITAPFKSPVDLLSAQLIDSPVVGGQPDPPAATDSLSATSAPTTSASTPSATPQSGSAFPISPPIRACADPKTSCVQSGTLFSQCINAQDPSANITTWSCLCNQNFAQWNSTTLACSSCIASALPPNNPTATVQSSQVLNYVNLSITDYCRAEASPEQLVKVGKVLTSAFQTPILWWNMTVITAPIPWSVL